ncbi:MAG: hypothetical protein V4671_03480, partial [Armatimonadota bacterium]
MGVIVEEYLGRRTDTTTPLIPVISKSGALCPFTSKKCIKVSKGQKPLCTLRLSTGEAWISCEFRLLP